MGHHLLSYCVSADHVEQHVHESLTRLLGESRPQKFAVAVSGGSDSLALVYLIKEWCAKHKLELVALTVDHRLRRASTNEAHMLHNQLTREGVEHHILTWQHSDSIEGNLQEQARNTRYQLIGEFCRARHIYHLFVGHTLNDQAETVLMRLERGSGVDGLSAIAEISELYGMMVLRPLLGVYREILRDYLRAHHLEWVDDPSNEYDTFSRIRLRKLLIDAEDRPMLLDRLATTAMHMQQAKVALDYLAEQAFNQSVVLFNQAHKVDLSLLLSYPEDTVFRCLKRIFVNLTGKQILRAEPISALIKEIKKADFVQYSLLHCNVEKIGSTLTINLSKRFL